MSPDEQRTPAETDAPSRGTLDGLDSLILRITRFAVQLLRTCALLLLTPWRSDQLLEDERSGFTRFVSPTSLCFVITIPFCAAVLTAQDDDSLASFTMGLYRALYSLMTISEDSLMILAMVAFAGIIFALAAHLYGLLFAAERRQDTRHLFLYALGIWPLGMFSLSWIYALIGSLSGDTAPADGLLFLGASAWSLLNPMIVVSPTLTRDGGPLRRWLVAPLTALAVSATVILNAVVQVQLATLKDIDSAVRDSDIWLNIDSIHKHGESFVLRADLFNSGSSVYQCFDLEVCAQDPAALADCTSLTGRSWFPPGATAADLVAQGGSVLAAPAGTEVIIRCAGRPLNGDAYQLPLDLQED